MSYKLQTNWGGVPDTWQDSRAYEDLERGIKALQHDADLARVCCRLRLIDDNGTIYAVYEPEYDRRLPGPRWRATERKAKALWEAAGKPEGRDEEFWYKAEAELTDFNGVSILRLEPLEYPFITNFKTPERWFI
jgi:hypothetical protein